MKKIAKSINAKYDEIIFTSGATESNIWEISCLHVNEYGEIDLDKLSNSITSKTVMISIMTANNEIGTIADVEKNWKNRSR